MATSGEESPHSDLNLFSPHQKLLFLTGIIEVEKLSLAYSTQGLTKNGCKLQDRKNVSSKSTDKSFNSSKLRKITGDFSQLGTVERYVVSRFLSFTQLLVHTGNSRISKFYIQDGHATSACHLCQIFTCKIWANFKTFESLRS